MYTGMCTLSTSLVPGPEAHSDLHGEYPCVSVEPVARFSAAHGAASLRVRAIQTSIATSESLRAHDSEHQRAAEVTRYYVTGCAVAASESSIVQKYARVVRRPLVSQLRSWLIPMAPDATPTKGL